MPITINQSGVLHELKTITTNVDGVLHELDTITTNGGGVLYPIYSSFKPPTELIWTKMTAGQIDSTSNNGFTVKFSSYIGVWVGKPAFLDVPAGHCCITNYDIFLKAGTVISAKRTAYSGYGSTTNSTWLTIYDRYPDYTKRLSTSSLTAVTDIGSYTIPSDGYYRFGLYAQGYTGGQNASYYFATATVDITLSKS